MEELVLQASGVHITRSVLIAMRDGVHLAADIYRPSESGQPVADPLPVLLERTPYDKRGTNPGERTVREPVPVSKPESAIRLARAGYVVVVQDCRGRFESEGTFTKYVYEAEDGVDTVAWIMKQSWCNGRVGTYGLSYGAHVQGAMGCLNPPGISAMLIESGAFSDAFQGGIRQGGAFELKQATWAYRHALNSPETLADPVRRAELERQDVRSWFTRMPWTPGHSPISAAPEYESYLFDQWRSGLFTDKWKRIGLYAKGSYPTFSDVPTLLMTGWYDPYSRTMIDNFVGLSTWKAGPIYLIMGPWTHGQRSVTFAGDVDFGRQSLFDSRFAPDFFVFRRAWFDHWLKGAPSPIADRVNLFVMGGGSGKRTETGRLDHGGRWITSPTWPLPNVRSTAFYLHADGGLSQRQASSEKTFLSYRHDPRNPVPTIGGAITSGQPVMEAGAYDQREGPDFFGSTPPYRPIITRSDVLSFETEPLTEPVDLIGAITATLHVSSSCVDTDFTIKLVDVYPPNDDYPDGYALNLAHGILRARYREGFDREVRLEPGKVYPVTIEGFPTANHFAVGHRIRIEVASSNFPHFDVNPNSGEPEGFGERPQVAENRIFMDKMRPSCVHLPLVYK